MTMVIRERMPEPRSFTPHRIVSGGQTGVDRGALEAALALGIAHGGWCPRGRLAEDGSIPSRYELDELDSSDYAARTEQNVIDSDATLIIYERRMSGGTLLTFNLAKKWQRPHLTVRIDQAWDVERVQDWLAEYQPQTLNVAGPRESTCPGIQERSAAAVRQILTLPERTDPLSVAENEANRPFDPGHPYRLQY